MGTNEVAECIDYKRLSCTRRAIDEYEEWMIVTDCAKNGMKRGKLIRIHLSHAGVRTCCQVRTERIPSSKLMDDFSGM